MCGERIVIPEKLQPVLEETWDRIKTQCKLNYRNAIIFAAPAKNLVYRANGAFSGPDRATLPTSQLVIPKRQWKKG